MPLVPGGGDGGGLPGLLIKIFLVLFFSRPSLVNRRLMASWLHLRPFLFRCLFMTTIPPHPFLHFRRCFSSFTPLFNQPLFLLHLFYTVPSPTQPAFVSVYVSFFLFVQIPSSAFSFLWSSSLSKFPSPLSLSLPLALSFYRLCDFHANVPRPLLPSSRSHLKLILSPLFSILAIHKPRSRTPQRCKCSKNSAREYRKTGAINFKSE